MANIPENLEDILKKSIQLEEDGKKFYLESAKKIKNSLGKRMLERLAADEVHHIERIKEIYEAITDDKVENFVVSDANPVSFDDIFNRMKEQLQDAVEEMSETGVDDAEMIEMALELEHHGHFFYAEAAKKVKGKKVKQFYEMLAEEEKAHYDVLRKTHSFLEDPGLFFGMAHH
ncbi:MAG: ferritin family protein [Calditrichaceae bacterium]